MRIIVTVLDTVLDISIRIQTIIVDICKFVDRIIPFCEYLNFFLRNYSGNGNW